VSDALDREDPLPGHYVLEVSSPGVERPLRLPEHFARFVGTTVAVKLRASATPGDGRRLEGVLEAADADAVVVGGRRIAHDDIERARTVFSWGPKARPR
ncbi:MAG: ribosome maturation factor RimP, partial [Acidimicrobiales bacterium]